MPPDDLFRLTPISVRLYVYRMEVAPVFRALGDPTRLAVFQCLAEGELSVTELTERFTVSQPAISQHLSVLREVGLVETRRVGKNVYYKAHPKGIQPVVEWISRYRVFWNEKLPRLQAVLKGLSNVQ